MATSLAAISRPGALSAPVPSTTGVMRLVSTLMAVLSFAGGAIHFAVIRHHLDFVAMTTGFAVMGSAQWWFAVRMVRNPSSSARLVGLLLHGAIFSTWVWSRTAGLAFVPGAEERAAVGLPDVVANVFAVAVLASLAAMSILDRRPAPTSVSARASRAIRTVVAIGVLACTAPAVVAPHGHAADDRGGSTERAGGEHNHAPSIGDDHHRSGHQ